MHYKVYSFLLQLAVGSSLAMAQPAMAPAPSLTKDPGAPPSALDRYQDCFDKLVDQESTDQKFMRNCLGLAPHTRDDGRHEFLTREELKSGDEKRTVDISTCYAKALNATKALNIYPQGLIDIFVRIDADGAIKVFKIGKKSIQDSTVLTCVDAARKTWVFPKSTATATTPIRYQWDLAADKDRKPKVTLAPGYPKVKKPPGLMPAEIMPVIQANGDSIRGCYEALLKTEPQAQGKVIVEMMIGKRGHVRRAKILLSELPQPTLQKCILDQVGRLRFPPPRGGKPFPIRYPFLLTQMP